MTEPTAGQNPAAPQYPSAPPAYPTAPPAYPTQPPAYPTQPPAYPTSAPPAYPTAAIPRQHTPAPPPPPAPPVQEPPAPPAEPASLSFHTGRVHIAARQRGADATAIGELLLHLPNVLGSLIVVYLLAAFLPAPFDTVVVVCWFASGALVFHRPTERVLARYLFNLRVPTREELGRLEPLWREVTNRAGVDGSAYELWIEDSDDINASASAGHTVAVTRYSLNGLTPAQLAGVLAHELGHHRGGHAWASLLGFWYALPGRLAWQLLQIVAVLLFNLAGLFSLLGQVIVTVIIGCFVIALAATFPVLLLVFVTPYLMAAVGRRAELRADLHAAGLGFAPAMIEVLNIFRAHEEAAIAEAIRVPGGKAAVRRGPVERLLDSHPDHVTRIRRLEDYLVANP